eukprot:gnl/TRDRNA2_/TRDRNA2_30266_c0_seq1.p1 gnl/TRDRNA2_/TRDRNA2_30266_c0~~gnl/TRDRNA2_/TRDRNA2_30266_c0_seq1.p1  ORF type:complete len:484 (+),score=69.79 gnl/TRDRNA2_/TRDRNA2_30266_c0_seq1:47-1498(+)
MKRSCGKPVAASHIEVFRSIKRRKIHKAEDLYQLAQERSAKGDHALLRYCTGEKGMKRNLQSTIDSAWARSDVATISDHAAPLPADRLRELQAQARAPCAVVSTAADEDVQSRQVAKRKPSGSELGKIVDARARVAPALAERSKVVDAAKTGRQRGNRAAYSGTELLFFDHYTTRAEIIFKPHGGIWRLRDFFEVLVSCSSSEAALAGIRPAAAAEGGFTIPRSELGWHAMLRSKVTTQRCSFKDLADEQHAAVAAEVRFGVGCGDLPWCAPAGGDADVWIDAMPMDPKFETDVLRTAPLEERLVRLWAYRHVEDRQLLAILRVLEACGHSIAETIGFTYSKKDGICVTSTRSKTPRHKHGDAQGASKAAFGMLVAPAAHADCRRRGSGDGTTLKAIAANDSSSIQRPVCNPQRNGSRWELAKAAAVRKRTRLRALPAPAALALESCDGSLRAPMKQLVSGSAASDSGLVSRCKSLLSAGVGP